MSLSYVCEWQTTELILAHVQTFALPNLSPRDKFKLTAHEGSKIRRVGFINFRSRSGVFIVMLQSSSHT